MGRSHAQLYICSKYSKIKRDGKDLVNNIQSETLDMPLRFIIQQVCQPQKTFPVWISIADRSVYVYFILFFLIYFPVDGLKVSMAVQAWGIKIILSGILHSQGLEI